MLKRLYHWLAFLALIGLFALGGFCGFLFASGRLDREKMGHIRAVLRGELPGEQLATATQPAVQEAVPVTSAEDIVRSQEKAKFYELLAERHQREIEDRRRLNLEIQLSVDRKLEDLAEREKRLQGEQAALRQESQLEGFEKQLDFISRAEPKKAKDLLRGGQIKEADVIQLLMKMDPNRVSKIVNACKTQDEVIWIGGILNQIGKLKSEVAAGVDGPSARSAGR